MSDLRLRRVVRAALLLALTLVFQSLRFIIPVPAVMSTFLIGTLVNASLLITLRSVGFFPALAIAWVTPLVAWLQQLLPLPVFIVPVALGNSLYVWLFYRLSRNVSEPVAVGAAATGKAVFFYVSFVWLLGWIELPPMISRGILFVMSWPQLVTGLAGGAISLLVLRKFQGILDTKEGNK